MQNDADKKFYRVSAFDCSLVGHAVMIEETACKDCFFRHPNPLYSGICEIYKERAKPGCVFRGRPCDYYLKDTR